MQRGEEGEGERGKREEEEREWGKRCRVEREREGETERGGNVMSVFFFFNRHSYQQFDGGMFRGINFVAVIGGRRVHTHPVIIRGIADIAPSDPDPAP